MEQSQSFIGSWLAWLGQFAGSEWLAQIAGFVSSIPPALVLGLLIVPLALVLASRRIFAMIAILLLAGTAWSAFLRGTDFSALAAPVIYLATVIVAAEQFLSARRQRRLNAQLDTLSADVARLRDAEARRYIVDLKSPDRQTSPFPAPNADGQTH